MYIKKEVFKVKKGVKIVVFVEMSPSSRHLVRRLELLWYLRTGY